MSRRQAATGLVAGLAMIVAAPVVWWAAQPAPAGQTVSTVNAAAANDLASPSLMTSGAAGTASAGSSVPPAPAASTGSTAPATAAAEPAPPVRIELPTLGVDTVVVPVGVDGEGLVEVPQDVSEVGWYRFGPAPGAATGSAVLTGHVDDHVQGVGVFGRIGDLGPGDAVRVADESGLTREFSVVSREEWSKGQVPLDRLFDRGGSSRLVLITCGGTFDNSTLGYDDNIAITAVPVAP
ncbi:MAG TPA: class F sortase [Nakamurella sp.]